MKVAIVAESFLPSINGVTNSVLRTLEHLRKRGDEAIVITSTHPAGVPERYEGFEVHTTASIRLPWYQDLRFSVTTSHTIAHLFGEFHPDVVHLAAPMILGKKAMLAAARLAIPTVALYQTEVPLYAGKYGYGKGVVNLLWWYMRTVHNLATITLAPSSYTQRELRERGFARVDVWGRGVDTARFDPAKSSTSLRRRWAPNGEVIVGYMGRLGPEKKVEDLKVLESIPGISLVIIGDGPARAELENTLPNAHFTGMLTGDALPRHVASLDLFVHPGELETFGQAIQEAQASGLACIAPKMGGPIDLISPSHNGWLYPPGDLDALRSCVADLVGDENKRRAFGDKARRMVEKRTWPAVCEQLIDHYHRAIELSRTHLPDLPSAGADSAQH